MSIVKNLSLILNGILIIAVGILYYLHFSSGHVHQVANNTQNVSTAGGNTLVYIMEDSLMNHYQLFKELSGQINKKQQDMEASYQARAVSLQKEIDNYKKMAPRIAPRDAQNVEDQLMQKQQSLYQYQQSLSQEIMDEQQQVNDQLYGKVSGFLKDYAAQNGYQVVLNYKRGSGMLYGVDMLDITNDVVKGLNEQYSKEKNAGVKLPAFPDSTNKKN